MDSFKKIILPILLVIVFIVLAGAIYRKSLGLSPFPFNEVKTSEIKEIKTVKIGLVSVKAEIADSNQERQKGLSGRSNLDQGAGMLFLIDGGKTTPTFWMKDMKFPIDIIWIKDDQIIQIDKNVEVPSPQTPDNKLSLYSPKSAVSHVLEVNAGFCDLNNIKVGDSVLIE